MRCAIAPSAVTWAWWLRVSRDKAYAATGTESMTDKPRVWISRPTFPGVIARLEPHFEVTEEPEERKFAAHALAAKLAGQDAVIVGLKDRIGPAEIARAERLPSTAGRAGGKGGGGKVE